jgi:hypothetical protein
MDWKSGGDTNFAPLASADGQLDCRGFWDKGKCDKDALWTPNSEKAPTLRDYIAGVGANFGRVRIIKLQPQDHEQALKSIHRDDNNRFNPEGTGWVVRNWIELTDDPDSYMLLMEVAARRHARSRHRGPRPAAAVVALHRRHPAAVARRGAQPRPPRATRSSPASRAVPCSSAGSRASSPSPSECGTARLRRAG